MAEFYLPYHFVPVARGGRKGDLAAAELRKGGSGAIQGVRHDRYEAGTHSGTVECMVEAASPIFVGDEKQDGEGEVQGFRLDGKPALPASSLRGMVASLAEAASNSALRVLSQNVLGQPCYSYRKPMREPLTAIGILRKEGNDWKLEPVCLPLLQYVRKQLKRDLRKWQRVFPSPVFRVFDGDKDAIRRDKDDLTDPNKKAWRRRTTSVPMGGIPVRQLQWGQLTTLADGLPLNIKEDGDYATVVAQKMERVAKVDCLVRVLGCYEKSPEGDLRKIAEGKLHELLLPYPVPRPAKLPIPNETIECFQQLSDQMTEDSKNDATPRPYEPKDTRPGRKLKERLQPQAGDLVFFDVDEALRVTEIAYSSIWRGRVEADGKGANAWTFFDKVDSQLPPFHAKRSQVTLAERVFGFVEERGGKELRNGLRLKGRVRFSEGLAYGDIRELGLTPLRELSSPKPPSPALYFRHPQGRNDYIAKSDLQPESDWPQGRKMYLHHPDAIDGNETPWVNRGDFIEKRHVRIRPWAKGSKWCFEVRFDNLDDLELGMLLYALSPAEEFRHKIGMGKPVGLGSVEITVERVRTVARERRYSVEGWSDGRFGTDLKWRDLRDQFRNGINEEIRAALEEIGNPAKLTAGTRIGYPRVERQTDDDKLYQWFVSNDNQRDRTLQVALQPVAISEEGQVRTKIQPLPELRPARER